MGALVDKVTLAEIDGKFTVGRCFFEYFNRCNHDGRCWVGAVGRLLRCKKRQISEETDGSTLVGGLLLYSGTNA